MTQADLIFFKEWFSGYCRSFYSLDREDQKNIRLKEEHTSHVCENIRDIAGGLSLGDDRMTLAEAIALFHDIGRFPQYAKYRTFRDSISVNHGLLGAQTLIRDADKLDIWRVFLDYYEGPDESRASAVALGLPETPEYSEDALSSLYNQRIVPLSTIKTLNDFKLLQLSWVFDLHFLSSFRLLSERNYIGRITAHLPQTEAIHNLALFLKGFVKAKTSP